ncbi:MAG: PilZ domain-containing protein [Anaerolineae bacterium]|nr:PilZ domain-containing protein [Anaerolineae bacterium]MBT7075719.1 PilZ domain-containing protein [Anaerolineae bacterium]MBT7781819.1 PilZ domain-containing protein [Anaerolineae bacterium]
MSDYGDRRKEARKHIMSFTLVHDAKTGNLLGYLRDITLKGMQVNGSKNLDTDTEVVLSTNLPNDIPEALEKELHIRAKVMRCITVTEEPSSYEIGFEFTNLPSQDKALIKKFLEKYQFSR